MLSRSIPFASLSFLAFAASAEASVIVVGPGQAYTSLQAAVNAAAPGDTLLVRPGTYADVILDGKALTIAGDGATRPVVWGLTIRNVPAGGAVVISRLSTPTYCMANAGELRFADCDLYTPQLHENAGAVAFTRCTMTGWSYPGIGDGSGTDGGDGLLCRGTRVAIFDCTLQGGDGQDDITFAGHGGDGLRLMTSMIGLVTFAHVSNSTAAGGGGGDTWEDLFLYLAMVGYGGSGLYGEPGTNAWIIDSSFAGGPGGQWHNCPPASYGGPGFPMNGPGSRTTFNAESLSMSGASLARAGSVLVLDVVGEPGDEIRLVRGATAAFLAQASWRGPILERWRHPQYDLVDPYVVLDVTGHGTIHFPVPPVDAGGTGRVFLQPYRRHANGTYTIGSVLPLTVVDSIY